MSNSSGRGGAARGGARGHTRMTTATTPEELVAPANPILEAIGQLREEMGNMENRFSQKVDDMENRSSQKVDAMEERLTAQIKDVQKDVKDVQILQGAMTEAHFEVLTRNSQLVYNMKFASLEKALKAGVALLKTNAQSASLFELKDVQSHTRKIAKRLYDSGDFLRFMYEVNSVVEQLPAKNQEALAALFENAETNANVMFQDSERKGRSRSDTEWAYIKSTVVVAGTPFPNLVGKPARGDKPAVLGNPAVVDQPLEAKMRTIWLDFDNCDSQAAVFGKLLHDAATEFQDMCNKATNSAFPPLPSFTTCSAASSVSWLPSTSTLA
ncbi:hypothetical protein CAOG_009812 [Capsaspora owczarzaki ATCC 30864]|uniref:Uncharacterized protein n=1 Tax=Capsaspora owczarzaki (strain ATCC 30864) TaxID=595528 RepID=A0A0D2WR74_CAPO3|nr:hypothetical protein CAOG_009812 [Capsaspora owczarzaki ATCC 30864]